MALLRGPLVLFAIRTLGETGPIALSANTLLNAARTGLAEWSVAGVQEPRLLVPFTEVGEREYTTYLALT